MYDGHPMQCRWFALTMITICSAALALQAEEASDPPSASRDWFHLDPRQLYIGFEGDYEERRVLSSRPDRRNTLHENRDLRLDGLLGFGFDSYLYDPNLLAIDADLELGVTQTRFVEEIDGFRQTERDNGFLNEFDIRLDALSNKPISFSGYARRYDDRVPRRFLPSLHDVTTEFGISALATFGDHQTELGFSWRDIDRTGNRDDLDDESIEVSRFYLDHTWTISEDQRLRLQYDHNREESTYQGSAFQFDTRRDELRLEHELVFGSEKQHRLDTFFRYDAEQGDLARDELELVPRLTLQHTDRFRTVYRYGLYQFDQGALSIDQHKFDVQAIYEPIDDLRLSGDVYGLYERADQDIETYEFGGGLDVDYHRETGAGDLRVNAAFAYDRSRTHGDPGQRVVRNEAHQLGGSRPVYLRERDILLSTIIAHNGTRTRIFVPGVDYIVTPLADRVRVDSTFTGRIAQGDVVYFDYAYATPVDVTVNGYRSDLLVEHAFDFGLTPYYAFESRCEDTETTRLAERYRDNSHRHRLGLRFSRDRYAIGTEYEIFDDTIEPYDAWHATGRAVLLRTADHTLDTSAELSHYWFEGGFDVRQVWWLDLDLRDRIQLNRHLSLLTALDYHWEDDSIDGETNGLDVEFGIEFVRGYLSIDLTFEYDLLHVLSNEEQGYGVYLNIRRDLSHLLTPLSGGGT